MGSASRATFEVQRQRDGRWTMESICETEDEARSFGRKMFSDRKCAGVRIVRNWQRADGQIAETVVHEETRIIADDDNSSRIVAIEEPPPICRTQEEFYALEARSTVQRLLRNYLEKVFLTPTEIIHNYKELKRLQDSDNLFPSAVDRVATLQSRVTGEDSRERRDFIYKTVDAMAARARKADALKLPSLHGTSFNAVVTQIGSMAPPDDRDYLVLTALSRELVGTRNWLGKLQRLIQFTAEEGLRPDAMALLDGVIADLIGAQMLQDLMGWQPSLADALCHMFDLAEGKMPFKDTVEADDPTVILNKLFAAQLLPSSKATLVDRVLRHLRGAQPLYRSDPSREMDAFRKVGQRVMGPRNMLGGSETAEALTVRFSRMVDQGGAPGRRAAIRGVLTSYVETPHRLIYLLDLSSTELAKEHMADVTEHLKGICRSTDFNAVIPRSVPPKERMRRVTEMHRAVMASTLPEAARRDLAGGLDDLLAEYIISEGIIEKLDHKDASLRERATWLVQFCAAQILPEGRALKLARDRVISLLRQTNFDARFVEGMADAATAQKALRDFHHLLVKAGFGG